VNAHQAAEKIGTDARTLRRFLRSPKSTFKAVGSRGRYEFEDNDIPVLRKKFAEWRMGISPSSEKPEQEDFPMTKERQALIAAMSNNKEKLPKSVLNGRLTRQTREQRDALSRARVERLEAALLLAGKHISQRKDWAESR
jgi:predicted site-specific integrase-resolvase